MTRTGELLAWSSRTGPASRPAVAPPARRSGSGAWSRSPALRPVEVAPVSSSLQRQHPRVVAVRAPRRRGPPRVLPRRQVEVSRSSSCIVDTTPRGWCGTMQVRSCTQTRWPSAVSRTSHSRPSAPSSRPRRRRPGCARRCVALEPRWATTCGRVLTMPPFCTAGGSARGTGVAGPDVEIGSVGALRGLVRACVDRPFRSMVSACRWR